MIFLGTDSPSVPLSYIRTAFEALSRVSVVLGPVKDGGYFLLGLSEPNQELFCGISWGSGEVFQETIAKLSGKAYETLPEWHDIDVADDLPGRDLRPLMAREGRWVDRCIYAEYFAADATQLMIRRGPFKLWCRAPYGKWDEFRYHLFNVEKDPWELHDLVHDPAHERVLKELQADLTTVWERQRQHLPPQIPPPTPPSPYNIPWPADPWKGILPISTSAEEARRRSGQAASV